MLAALLNVPETEEQWSLWSFNNFDCVNQIRQTIKAKLGITLPEYQIEPINFSQIETWLENNQQAHIDFTGALGQQSNNLLEVDLSDPRQKSSFVWLNYMELLGACQTLKIGP